MINDTLSSKQIGSQASRRVTRPLAWIQPVCTVSLIVGSSTERIKIDWIQKDHTHLHVCECDVIKYAAGDQVIMHGVKDQAAQQVVVLPVQHNTVHVWNTVEHMVFLDLYTHLNVNYFG